MTLTELRRRNNGIYVHGLQNYVLAPAIRSDVLAKHLDVPHEWILSCKDAVVKLPPGTGIPLGLKAVNRYIVELSLFMQDLVGPKWAAIQYGISIKSLLGLLAGIRDKEALLPDDCDLLIDEISDVGVVNSKRLEMVIDSFLKVDGLTIFSSLDSRTEYLAELGEGRLGVKVEIARDSSILWAKARNKKLKAKFDTATAFCSVTGLPVSVAHSEYLKSPKPGRLEPDRVAWFYLLENKSFQRMLFDGDRARLREFEKIAR